MLLDDAILELFDAGVYEPAEIAKRLQRRKVWLVDALVEHANHLVTQRSRELAISRNVALPPQLRRTAQDEYGPLVWIPGKGRVPLASVGVEDLRARAEFHRELAGFHEARAAYYDDLADQLQRAGLARVVDLGVDADEFEVAA